MGKNFAALKVYASLAKEYFTCVGAKWDHF